MSSDAVSFPEQRKLFVDNLSDKTTDESLEAHFAQYGEIEHCYVSMDPSTGKSRGFGIITYKSKKSLDDAQAAAGPHILDGQEVNPRQAMHVVVSF